jgi:diguanylate cyclase (GGDEF)-like protein
MPLVGGPVLHAIIGDNLKDIFTTDTWREHFTTLSDGLGFSLSIYSQTGTLIFSAPGIMPLCRAFRDSSPDLQSRCRSSCYQIMMKTLQTGRPDIFKCYAGITSFALPIVHGDERAVILGQGSFSSYEDFRTCMELVNSAGLEMFSIPMPLTFTGFQHAWKVCGIVADFVQRLIKNSEQTSVLKKKFESLKSVFSLWSIAADGPPETRYQGMLYNLSTLLDLESITIFTLDQERSGYVSLYGVSKGGVRIDVLGIKAEDAIAQELQSGKPFVRSGAIADAPSGKRNLIHFPVMINSSLEGILTIADRALHDRDLQIIMGFCKQTALFIENYYLHQNLYGKIGRLAEISELTKTITSIQNYETLLRAILDKSAELLKAEQGSLMLLDHETEGLLLQAKKGIIEGVTETHRINRGEGIAGRVAELGEAMLVQNVEHDPRTMQKNRNHYKTPSFISVPLKIEDRVIGVLNLSDKTTGAVFDEDDLRLIQSFATHAAIVMERNVFYTKTEELKRLTITDSLTGLLNRRYLYERLKDELARSVRYGHPMSLLMLDLDGFKYCNDTFGHTFGDKMLISVAEMLLNTVRSMDVVARVGGDEFMIILPETPEQQAVDIAERVRSTIAEQASFPNDPSRVGPRSLTASIGIVCYPKGGESLELLLENVDKALYRGKNKGKNTIEVYS